MIIKIKTVEDVKAFARELILEDKVNFHPDEDFKNYVTLKYNLPCYSKKVAEFKNKLMEKCFLVCEKAGADIYDVMNGEVIKIENSLKK